MSDYYSDEEGFDKPNYSDEEGFDKPNYLDEEGFDKPCAPRLPLCSPATLARRLKRLLPIFEERMGELDGFTYLKEVHYKLTQGRPYAGACYERPSSDDMRRLEEIYMEAVSKEDDNSSKGDEDDDDNGYDDVSESSSCEIASEGSSAAAGGKPIEREVDRLRESLAARILDQMVNKKSLKGGSSRLNIEIPNLTLAHIEAMLGPQLWAKAKKGPKQITVTTSGAEMDILTGGRPLSRSLQHGVTLVVRGDAIRLTYHRESQALKATGAYIAKK